MTDQPHDSRTVRAPSTGEHPFEPAEPVVPSGSTTAVIAVVAIALVVLIGGAAGLVLLRGGGSDTDATQAVTSSGESGAAGSVDDVPPATAESGPPVGDAVAAQDTAVAPLTASPVTAPPAPPEPTAPPTIAPPPARTPAQVGAPTIAATVTRPGGLDSCTPPNETSYDAGLAYDGSTSTAWMAPGNGVDQRLVFTFPVPVIVSEVGLFPGYGKFDPCSAADRFFQLRRIGSVRWSFEDGSVVDQSFTSEKAVQRIQFAPRTTRSVTITILTTVAPGVARLDHTPISEVVIS